MTVVKADSSCVDQDSDAIVVGGAVEVSSETRMLW